MFCYKCGTELDDNAKFCHKCGASQVLDDEPVIIDPDKENDVPSSVVRRPDKENDVPSSVVRRPDRKMTCLLQ